MSKLFGKLAEEENNFLKTRFLSPVLKDKPIRVRISGIILEFSISRPKNFSGWGIFQPLDHKQARFVRAPSMSEKSEYLKLFPVIRLILCKRNDDKWFGMPAGKADGRFKIDGLIPVGLPEETQMFDVVKTRFDGSTCWFDAMDDMHSVKNASFLRDALAKEVTPDNVSLTGLSTVEKDAYFVCYTLDIQSKKDMKEEKIKEAIQRAGATYKSYIERKNTYTIEYEVDGESHRSTVDTSLNVQTAGICLSGGDKAFDLQSLVGVVREGIRRRSIVNTNDGDYDDDYD